jgi:hypothetical protein
MLKRREESDTYLTHVCRHLNSGDSLEKRLNMRSFQPSLWLSSAVDVYKDWVSLHLCLQLMKATVLAESSSYLIFSPGYLRYWDVNRHESGRCHSLPFFLTFFIIMHHIIPSYCHLPVSCRSLVDRCGSLGSCKPQIILCIVKW